MKKFDEAYERLMEQYKLDESFLGTLGNLIMSPLKAYKDAIVAGFKDTAIGRAFSELQNKIKKPSEKLKGVLAIINEIKRIIDETAKSSTKQITFKSKTDGSRERFNINDFFSNKKELNPSTSTPSTSGSTSTPSTSGSTSTPSPSGSTSTPSPSGSSTPAVVGKRVEIMKLAKQAVASMDFSYMVDSNQNLIKSAIKTLKSDKEWKQENPDVKVDENQILTEIKRILKSQISRANTKVKFEDKLLWLYLLASSTETIEV
jgi:hypothetical protein